MTGKEPTPSIKHAPFVGTWTDRRTNIRAAMGPLRRVRSLTVLSAAAIPHASQHRRTAPRLALHTDSIARQLSRASSNPALCADAALLRQLPQKSFLLARAREPSRDMVRRVSYLMSRRIYTFSFAAVAAERCAHVTSHRRTELCDSQKVQHSRVRSSCAQTWRTFRSPVVARFLLVVRS